MLRALHNLDNFLNIIFITKLNAAMYPIKEKIKEIMDNDNNLSDIRKRYKYE